MEERLKLLRKTLGYSQKEFGDQLGLSRDVISNIELGRVELKDHISKLICSHFNVSEKWLRTGKDEMFVQTSTFSLDDYAKQSDLSDLEMDIIKGYIGLDSSIRKTLISHFKSIFDNHNETAMTTEDYINKELEDYKLELQAEQKGIMSSALPDIEEKDA